MTRVPWRRDRGWRLVVAILLAVQARSLGAQATRAPRTAFLLVAGVGGEPRLADTYYGYASAIAGAATTRFGVPEGQVVILAEDSTRAHVRARSTRDNVLRELSRLSSGMTSGDRLVLMLFGHGSAQGDESRFNVPGPDLTPGDFAAALAPLREVSVLVVNTTSASGDFVKPLAGPNRVLIAATRSAREQNETIFPAHFVAALTDASSAADADKDGRVNLLEAFTYASREVERVFAQANRIVTEHAVLDDDGDGTAHADASERGPDGIRARAVFLEPSTSPTQSADPRIAKLVAERREVEGRLDALRARRSTMGEEAYQQALEPLLVELAEKSRALRALEGRKP